LPAAAETRWQCGDVLKRAEQQRHVGFVRGHQSEQQSDDGGADGLAHQPAGRLHALAPRCVRPGPR